VDLASCKGHIDYLRTYADETFLSPSVVGGVSYISTICEFEKNDFYYVYSSTGNCGRYYDVRGKGGKMHSSVAV
jgi:hypothetical protein